MGTKEFRPPTEANYREAVRGYTLQNERQDVNLVGSEGLETVRMTVNRLSAKRQERIQPEWKLAWRGRTLKSHGESKPRCIGLFCGLTRMRMASR